MIHALPSNARQAALLLHSLPAADRDWLLAALPAAQRSSLQALLTELRELGIPADRALVDKFFVQARPASANPRSEPAAQHVEPQAGATAASVAAPAIKASEPESLVQWLEAPDDKELEAVIRVLSAESPGVIVKVLGLQAWSWRNALVNRLDTVKRRQVDDVLRGIPADRVPAPAAPAFEKTLLKVLRRRVAAQRGIQHRAPAAGKPVSGLGGWAQKLMGRGSRQTT